MHCSDKCQAGVIIPSVVVALSVLAACPDAPAQVYFPNDHVFYLANNTSHDLVSGSFKIFEEGDSGAPLQAPTGRVRAGERTAVHDYGHLLKFGHRYRLEFSARLLDDPAREAYFLSGFFRLDATIFTIDVFKIRPTKPAGTVLRVRINPNNFGVPTALQVKTGDVIEFECPDVGPRHIVVTTVMDGRDVARVILGGSRSLIDHVPGGGSFVGSWSLLETLAPGYAEVEVRVVDPTNVIRTYPFDVFVKK
jgi:hypothetical protein